MFFAAMNARRDREAFKVLGALRIKAHDTRELAYLESLAFLRSGDYDGALANAHRVKPGDIDYVMAQGVALESLCFIGESEAALEFLQRNLAALEGNASFAAYVGLVLLNHSPGDGFCQPRRASALSANGGS